MKLKYVNINRSLLYCYCSCYPIQNLAICCLLSFLPKLHRSSSKSSSTVFQVYSSGWKEKNSSSLWSSAFNRCKFSKPHICYFYKDMTNCYRQRCWDGSLGLTGFSCWNITCYQAVSKQSHLYSNSSWDVKHRLDDFLFWGIFLVGMTSEGLIWKNEKSREKIKENADAVFFPSEWQGGMSGKHISNLHYYRWHTQR